MCGMPYTLTYDPIACMRYLGSNISAKNETAVEVDEISKKY